LEEAITRYLKWVEKQYGNLDLRGLKPLEQGPPLTLNDVYVSLEAEMRVTGREKLGREKLDLEKLSRREMEDLVEQQVKTVSMAQLLADNPRLVIAGGPGSGKRHFYGLLPRHWRRHYRRAKRPT
jgi:hypothetical protein